MASVKAVYLGFYNSILAGGWFNIFLIAVKHLYLHGEKDFTSKILIPLYVWQSAALLEIIHSLLGIVRAPLSAALPQIGSRLFVTWGVLYSFPESQNSIFTVSLILSWSIVEIVRYTFFAIKELFGKPPYFLLWLRYSLFFVLYPTGIASEIGVTLAALPYIKASTKYNIVMPNAFNFAFDYYLACLVVLVSYTAGGPYLYTYMMSQRKKALAKEKSA